MKQRKLRKLLLTLFLVAALICGTWLVLQPTKLFKRAFGVKADLVIDAGSSYSLGGNVWQNLAQGGEEKTRMLASVIDKIKVLQPEYIRIDHIFDGYDIVSRDGSGSLVFNFSLLDQTLTDITAVGAKPFISLSYMPPVISKGDINDLPKAWSDWELSVQKLVEHISGKGGLGIGGVYYEVWNEPDLFGKFKTSGEKNYLDLYQHTAIAVGRSQNTLPFKIGGPATTALYKAWFDNLLKFTSENNLRLDFYSWHRYSKDLEDFENDYLQAATWLSDYPQYSNLELIISEAGPNSENDKAYDNAFGAIHTLAVNTLMENKITRLFTFEIKDGPGPEQYWERWGILTHEKFGEPQAKPRYHALAFLNRMQGKKINVAGEGSWVKAFAKEDKAIIKILIVNYDPAGRHFEDAPLTFVNLPFRNFIFRKTSFGGKAGEIKVATDSAFWKTQLPMEANTATIIELMPL